MRPWIFLVLSALLQVGWLVSLRQTEGFTRFVPLLFYAFFGFTSAYCLSRSLDGIPMSTAYAVWTGISVAGTAIVDLAVFRQLDLSRMLCIALILAGTAGLRVSPASRGSAGTPPIPAPEAAGTGAAR
jgi:quaternary ammonium compound-resistance protein SugE